MGPSELKRQVNELLKLSFVIPSVSHWVAPALLIGKKAWSKRSCVDYNGLNAVTRNKYFLLRIIDLVDQLEGAKRFLRNDLRFGFYQIRVHKTFR